MKYYIQIIAISLFLSAHLCFCKSQRKKNDVEQKIQVFKDTVVKDIPKYYQQVHIKREKQELENRIGLPSLEEGFDGIQIKIWVGNSRSDTLLLLTITNFDSIWSANFYTIKYQMSDKKDSMVSFKSSVLAKSPKSGWKFFIDSLYKLNILTLPDHSIIPGYNVPMDSGNATIEVANTKTYRIYSLPSPNENRDIWQAERMFQILKFCENELRVKLL